MQKNSFIEKIKKSFKREEGFTMLDAVITAALVIALAVGGFMVYKDVVKNTKENKVQAAVTEVINATAVYSVADATDKATAAEKAKKEYMDSQGANPKIIIDIETF